MTQPNPTIRRSKPLPLELLLYAKLKKDVEDFPFPSELQKGLEKLGFEFVANLSIKYRKTSPIDNYNGTQIVTINKGSYVYDYDHQLRQPKRCDYAISIWVTEPTSSQIEENRKGGLQGYILDTFEELKKELSSFFEFKRVGSTLESYKPDI